jgi:DNA-directed RNA polymerase specialized sigma24 family protein
LEGLLDMTETDQNHFILENALTRLEALSPPCYEAVSMHYFLGFSVENIAEKLNLNTRKVYRNLATAKAFIHTQLQ